VLTCFKEQYDWGALRVYEILKKILPASEPFARSLPIRFWHLPHLTSFPLSPLGFLALMAVPTSVRAEAVRLFDEAKLAPTAEKSLENLGKVRELVISILISVSLLVKYHWA
jgi:hypothetical protein